MTTHQKITLNGQSTTCTQITSSPHTVDVNWKLVGSEYLPHQLVGTTDTVLEALEIIYSGTGNLGDLDFRVGGPFSDGSTPPTPPKVTHVKFEGEDDVIPKVDVEWGADAASGVFNIDFVFTDPETDAVATVTINHTGETPPAKLKVKIRRQTAGFTCP